MYISASHLVEFCGFTWKPNYFNLVCFYVMRKEDMMVMGDGTESVLTAVSMASFVKVE
jgi:hypothetical protein